MNRLPGWFFSIVLGSAITGIAADPQTPTSLQIVPERITLDSRRDERRMPTAARAMSRRKPR
jgi:hypothetical protein